MVQIEKVIGREIIDSRGNPTVEVDVTLVGGYFGRAACPSGASTGTHEAIERRDGDSRFLGKGVRKVVEAINTDIRKALTGMDGTDQAAVDNSLISIDGTENKGRIGANALLPVSMAVARAAAQALQVPLYEHLSERNYLLPVPYMNILNGGAHANWQGADFQEYMIAPVGAPDFPEAVRWGCEVYHSLKSILKKQDLSTGVGDEGGFAPKVPSNRAPLDFITEAIEAAGYKPGSDIALALDPASSEFFIDGTYELKSEGKKLSSEEMAGYYQDLTAAYPVISIEDGLAEDDWDGWIAMTKAIGKKVQLVGDDLFVTNTKRISRGISEKAANAVLIKLNQIGTITETIAAVTMARNAGWNSMISHRSGETVDSFIADLSVSLGTGQIKTGAPCRGERVEKYNQLIRIHEELGSKATYAGKRR
ncbi:phosphopyruvate hydratase [Methanospirillum sp. J.3.6.1-F.2.7.3]|uniref:Enolase n=1 Tax=Methanospirillum purgamenti TaxID=2834276 RepID=A0A8E7B0G3_9EURY|nr:MULTISPECIES: phosphopyruvate hydratase [Methanospirillum]MDX8550311.1 phosphopyruvate hydratase [Methanospirillum hungatei]QVV88026.1 phosphopyruvate hydratase [Methanospirillum sp. J.3.6.1-F.2.7.3]